jgi:transcriptional regulator
MYNPSQFRETRAEVLQAFIAQHPLGALVAMSAEGLIANHIPMLWKPSAERPGLLQGHVARANPLWRSVAPDALVLVIFGGANHYLTPSWYPAKQEHGKVVPTWNYSVVHVHGTIQFRAGDVTEALRQVSELTDRQESARAAPWAVSDAPRDYIEAQLRAIVPFEIAVTRWVGKFKASQHREERERQSVNDALAAEGVGASERGEIVRPPQK